MEHHEEVQDGAQEQPWLASRQGTWRDVSRRDVTSLYHIGSAATSRVVASQVLILDADEYCYWDTPITSAGHGHQ